MTRDAIMAELLEIEGLLQDDRLNDHDRFALQGAQQALRHISSTPRPGTEPLRHSIGLTIGRAKPFPCFCTSYGGCPLMLHLLVDWEYPHWMMMAGAILVALGFVGFAFHRNRSGPVNESSRARESIPTERLKAMQEFASAGGQRKAKGK
jgi:hypothetical protein